MNLEPSLKRICPRNELFLFALEIMEELCEILQEAHSHAIYEDNRIEIFRVYIACSYIKGDAQGAIHGYKSGENYLLHLGKHLERLQRLFNDMAEGHVSYLTFETEAPFWMDATGVKSECEFAGFILDIMDPVFSIGGLLEDLDSRIETLLALAPEEKIRELEKAREELEASRARVSSARRNERQRSKARQ